MKRQMNPNTLKLHDMGQGLWLDNITRDLLDSGTLAHYIAKLSVTGLTSNPTIFEQAIGSGASYDAIVQALTARGLSEEGIYFELALQDLTRAAELFRPVFDASEGVDGWVSLEVSPLLAADTAGTIHAAAQLHARAARPKLFIAVAMRCNRVHRELLDSARWRKLAAAGARPQRLLWTSTSTKDPAARDTLYLEALAAPETINTIPEKTLLAFADHGQPGATLPADGGLADTVLEESRREGVDDEALAAQLQRDGVLAFAKSWGGLLARIREKSQGSATATATASAALAGHPQ